MTSTRRPLLVAGFLAAALLLGVLGYAFRSRLAWLPLVGRLAAPAATVQAMWVCPMHPEVRQPGPGTCPRCGMELVREHPVPPGGEPARSAGKEPGAAGGSTPGTPAPRAPMSLDLRRQQLVGVRLAAATVADLSREIRALGVVRYDETREADINLKVEAWIQDLYVDYTGQAVTRGQPLFSVYSPDLVSTQHEYLLALRTRDQMHSSQVADAREYADRLVAAARQRLALWDMPPAQIEALERTRDVQKAVVFRSPASGVVVEKTAVKGMRVMPGQTLYKLVDLSVVWLEADVHERDLAFVKKGARAEVTLGSLPGELFVGRVTYLYPTLEEQTRTVRVRLELPNPRGRLKPGMFANVRLASPTGRGLVVPSDAVVDSGTSQFVFVAQGDGYFEPRRVTIGQRLDHRIQVVEGLEPGEQVAAGATFFLDSESQLRAAMQGFEDAPALDAGPAGGQSRAGPEVTFATQPDPPRHGDNRFEVRVRDERGAPITDADVIVRMYMAPMPSMNMPAMRAEARLLHAGAGVYRGNGNVSMAGRWDVTVVATRGGERLASRRFALVAQ